MNDNQETCDRQTIDDAWFRARRAERATQLTELAARAVAEPAALTLPEIQDIGWALLQSGRSLRQGVRGADRAMIRIL